MRQIICETIKLLWLLPLVLQQFAEIYHSQSETANQSQLHRLTGVDHVCVRTAHIFPSHSAYSHSSSRLPCAAALLIEEEQPNVTRNLLISESSECAMSVYPSSLVALLLNRQSQ